MHPSGLAPEAPPDREYSAKGQRRIPRFFVVAPHSSAIPALRKPAYSVFARSDKYCGFVSQGR